jgi:DNA invertase Pin-like site-specific DNA recombinase/predicted metal-binding protein
MKIVAYSYSDPLWETPTDPAMWGWEVDRIYQDLGERQQLEELLRDCQLDRINYLLVDKVEILGDSVTQASDRLQYFQSLGVRVITLGSETLAATQEYQILAQIQANYRSRQIRQGHARNRLQGAPPPGKAPYGYKRGKTSYIFDRQAAPIIKDFFAQFLLYGSLRSAMRYLAQKYQKQVSPATAQKWLTNPVYRGHTAYKNGETILNTHPAILTKEEAAQIDRLLQRNRNLPPRSASAPRSLAGLISCAQCQSPMRVSKSTSSTTGKEYLYLRPLRCKEQPKCQLIDYETILKQTITEICQSLPKAVANLQQNPPNLAFENIEQSLQSQIDRQQQILDKLPQLTANGILDRETAQIRAYKLNTEIAKLQGKLTSLPPVNLLLVAQAVSLPQFWLDLSEAERRFYFREFIRQIQLVRSGNEWQVRLVFIFAR